MIVNRRNPFRPLLAAFRAEQLKPTVILLVSPLLLVTWKYFGSPGYYLERLSPRWALWNDPVATAAAYSFLACFLLMAVVPALIVKLVFRQSLADYGVRLGDRPYTVLSFLVLAPVFVISAYVASNDPAVLAEYPINSSAGTSASTFAFHAFTYLAFYMGWEFHFRGFLQFGLRRSMGDANAVLIQVLASVLFHIDKPAVETYGAILAGILWGVLAFRTKSLLSGLMQHFLLGLSLDWFILFG